MSNAAIKVPFVWPTALNLTGADEAASGAARKWIQVAKTGQFFSQRYGKFKITVDDLKSMLNNFRTVTPIAPTQLPIDYDHLSMDPKKPGDGKAAGWFTGAMELRGDDQLWAEVEFNAPAAESIRNGEYRFFSPSFIRDYVWKNGQNIGTTLIAGAITNHPFLEGMAAITLSNDLGEMAVSLSGGAGMEVGQVVAIADTAARAPRSTELVGQPLEICEVAGQGNDAFAKLKGADGAEVGWYRVDELEPARLNPSPSAEAPPTDPAPAEVAAAHLREDNMAEKFMLRDSRGEQVEVAQDGLQQFIDAQINAARSAVVPEGSVVINASKLAEFETAAAQVTSLRAEVDGLRTAAEEAKKDAHIKHITSALDKMQQEGRVTRPQREWALKTFGDPIALAAFDEWAATCVKAVVNMGGEHGTSAGGDEAPASVDGQLLMLARERSKERNIDLRTAVSQISLERPDLAQQYRAAAPPPPAGRAH